MFLLNRRFVNFIVQIVKIIALMRESKGYIFDIKKYSINDGPGIRTTVFLKGCPLKCWWCHNPESQNIKPEEFIGCNFRWSMINGLSNNIVGSEVSADYIIKEIEKDLPFYEESEGGATFSGGEPMMQIDFLKSLLNKCKSADINTAVDTTGYTDFENFEAILDTADLFLYDLKLMNDNLHQKYTGVSNKIILENLKHLCETEDKVILRFPVIPSITDTERNLDDMINFISSLRNIRAIDLLPYHKSAELKYEKMKRTNMLPDLKPPGNELMKQIKNKFNTLGYEVNIGGY